jgi:acylphosphatase
MPRKHITVTGRVQRVGFRYHVYNLAQDCHLTGWVCNLDSGEVVIEVQGYQEHIEQLISSLGKGSIFIRIDRMEIQDCDEIKESGFDIKHE